MIQRRVEFQAEPDGTEVRANESSGNDLFLIFGQENNLAKRRHSFRKTIQRGLDLRFFHFTLSVIKNIIYEIYLFEKNECTLCGFMPQKTKQKQILPYSWMPEQLISAAVSNQQSACTATGCGCEGSVRCAGAAVTGRLCSVAVNASGVVV